MKLTSLSFGNVAVKATRLTISSIAISFLGIAPSQASTFTRTSPTSQGLLPSGVSEIGGVVLDLVGSNGTRVVTQASASSLFRGQPTVNPVIFGTQSGFTPTVISSLGGGISQASVRVSLFDGNTANGDFDFNKNTLLLNGISFGNFSTVNAVNTDANGNQLAAGFSGGGFREDILDTGFFFSNNSTILTSLFTSLNSGNVTFGLRDLTPGNSFFNFTRGINSSLINVGTGPIIQPSTKIPEPLTIIGTLIGGVTAIRMRKRLKATR